MSLAVDPFEYCPCDDNGGCAECHKLHVQDGITENYVKGYRCCADAFHDAIKAGEWCARKPWEHLNNYMDGRMVGRKFVFAKPGRCLECAEELSPRPAA